MDEWASRPECDEFKQCSTNSLEPDVVQQEQQERRGFGERLLVEVAQGADHAAEEADLWGGAGGGQ